MNSYQLPDTLSQEISELEILFARYRKGEISAPELKAHRVPFGVYEQRQPDTYMVRIRCAAGLISPGQLEQVAAIASQYGINTLHITTRQELQIHYVKLNDIVPVIRALKEIGLATRGGGGNTVRNITAQEDAGIDAQEAFDVTPYAIALTTSLMAEADSWTLPRKFKIAFSGSWEDKGYATIADLGFIAQVKDGKRGFKVYVAGGLGAKAQAAKPLFEFIEAGEVFCITKAVKTIFWKYGNRKNKHAARLRFLWNASGEEEFKKRFSEEYAALKQKNIAALAIEEIENRPSVSGLRQLAAYDLNAFALWKSRFARPQKQAGLFAVLIPIELGFITDEQALKLAQFLKAFGDNVLRLTKEQNFLLRNIPEAYLGNVYNFLTRAFENSNQPLIYGKLLSCAGASTCQLGICLSRQAAKALMRTLRDGSLDLDRIGDIKLNISGCPNSCGQHSLADLGFFGKAARKGGHLYPAYNVVAAAVVHNGQTKLAENIGEVAAKDLPAFVAGIFQLYLSNPAKGKTFREYIAQEGKRDLQRLLEKYKEIPSFEEDESYYYDWDAEGVFSLAGRRAGECSAGIFDLIEVDLGNINEARQRLSVTGVEREQKKQFLQKIVFYSSRMLLITRGIEPRNEEEVYAAFREHFMATGLVESSFRALIEAAQKKDYAMLLGRESQIYGLARKVELLYEYMDNSFNFKIPAPVSDSPEGEQAAIRAVKDFRGIACPMNFVKTKIELSKLKPGDILEIWLDDGAPIENVPGSVQAEGHKIIAQKKIGDYWSVAIEKK